MKAVQRCRETVVRIGRRFLVSAVILSSSPIAVQVSYADAGSVPAPGDQIVVQQGKKRVSCTLGPMLTDDEGRRYFLTAGHCGENNQLVTWGSPLRPLGRLLRPVYEVDDGALSDYALIPVGPETGTPNIVGHVTRGSQNRVSDNTEVCTFGSTTGQQVCGAVVSGGPETSYVTGIRARHGDSGAPVYVEDGGTGATVVGIVSARRDNENGVFVVVAPIGRALQRYGLELAGSK